MAGNTDIMMYLLEKGAPTPVIERLMSQMASRKGTEPLMSATRPGMNGNVQALNPNPKRSSMFQSPMRAPRR